MKMFCPCCYKEHDIEIVKKIENCIIKDEEIEAEVEVFYCDERNETFENGGMLNKNLLSIRDAYRKKHNLLTSNEIEEIRKKYSTSQADLALILGWGEVTITRYESKEIQTPTYDKILKEIRDNPNVFLEYLEKNRERISPKKYAKIKENAASLIDDKDDLELKKSIYNRIDPLSEDVKGNTKFDLCRVLAVIKAILNLTSKDLYKTRLAKYLWYVDALCYKRTNHSMTGLAYSHQMYGAFPGVLGWILDLKEVEVEVTEEDDSYKYLIKNVDSSIKLDDDETQIIEEIVKKFDNFSTSELVEYMHNEKAYLNTNKDDYIDYKYAKYLNEF